MYQNPAIWETNQSWIKAEKIVGMDGKGVPACHGGRPFHNLSQRIWWETVFDAAVYITSYAFRLSSWLNARWSMLA